MDNYNNWNYNNHGNDPGNHHNQYYPRYSQDDDVISVKDWILTFILLAIPVVNIILLFVWAFSQDTNESKKNYSKASLIMMAISLVIYILVSL